MNPYVDAFLKKALQQVRYKKMHPYLAQELNDHIELLKEELINEGMDEETAYEQAVKHMGQPESIGKSLHEIHKPKIEWGVVITLIAIIAVGLFVLGRCSREYSQARYIEKQLLFVAIGIVSFLMLYYMDYSKLERVSGVLYGLGAIAIIMTIITGREINGVRRWLGIGPIMISTSHIAMPLFIISYVGFIRKWANKGIQGYTFLIGTGLMVVILSMTMGAPQGIDLTVILLCIFITYVMSEAFKGNRKRVGAILLSVGILIIGSGSYFIFSAPWRVARLMAWIDPSRDPVDKGYSYNVIREILSGATWLGRGEGIKIEQIGEYLSIEADFIFTFIIGTMGYLVAGGIVILIGSMLIRCFKVTKKVNDEYGRMLLNAISIYFLIQYTMSLLVNISLAPTTAVSIPFMSYGGSGLVCDLAIMGLFLGIYRRKDIMPNELLKIKEETQSVGPDKNRKYGNLLLGWALHVLRTSEDIEEVNITFKQK